MYVWIVARYFFVLAIHYHYMYVNSFTSWILINVIVIYDNKYWLNVSSPEMCTSELKQLGEKKVVKKVRNSMKR